MASSISGAYSGKPAAFSSSDGFVVASSGRWRRMASISPVSATMAVMVLS
jgi:hypothetical protein